MDIHTNLSTEGLTTEIVQWIQLFGPERFLLCASIAMKKLAFKASLNPNSNGVKANELMNLSILLLENDFAQSLRR